MANLEEPAIAARSDSSMIEEILELSRSQHQRIIDLATRRGTPRLNASGQLEFGRPYNTSVLDRFYQNETDNKMDRLRRSINELTMRLDSISVTTTRMKTQVGLLSLWNDLAAALCGISCLQPVDWVRAMGGGIIGATTHLDGCLAESSENTTDQRSVVAPFFSETAPHTLTHKLPPPAPERDEAR